MLLVAGASMQQGRSALAALLLFALVVVVLLTAASTLLLILHRRRGREQTVSREVDAVDAWREAGRRARPDGVDEPPRETTD